MVDHSQVEARGIAALSSQYWWNVSGCSDRRLVLNVVSHHAGVGRQSGGVIGSQLILIVVPNCLASPVGKFLLSE